MDVAALALNIDSEPVRRAANDLDNFSKSADKAASSASKLSGSGSVSKMAQDYGRAAKAADMAGGSIAQIAATVTRANATMAAANDNAGRSFANANAHVLAYEKHLASLPAAANQAAAGIGRVTQAAEVSAGAMRANTGNIAAQFQDIGVTAAMGMNPLLIALQQGTQLSAVFAASGGSAFASIGAAIRQVISPTALFTVAIVALISYVVQLAMEMFNASDKTDKLAKAFDTAAFSTYALNDAQNILANVFDLTTGKIIHQTGALHDLARAQLLVAQAESMNKLAEHRTYLNNVANEVGSGDAGNLFWDRNSRGSLIARQAGPTFEALLAQGVLGGRTSTGDAMDILASMQKRGKLNPETFTKMLGSISGLGLEQENQKLLAEAMKSLESGNLAEQFRQGGPPSSRARSGGKSDADRWAEIVRGAEEATVAEQNRAKAVEMSAEAAAELEQRTRLLNAASSANLKLTPAMAQEIDKLAKAYAAAKVDADISEVVKKSTDEIQRQRDAIADEIALIGLRGEAYARAKREQDAQRKLRESLPEGSIYVGGNLTSGLSDDADDADRKRRIAKLAQDSEDAAYAMDLERGAVLLSGEAALQYAFVMERLNEAKRAGINLSPAEIAAIEAAGQSYARQRYALDRYQQAVQDARAETKAFFSDFMSGVRNGENVFKAFSNAVINSINRMIEKMLDRAIDDFFNKFQSGGGGGFFNSLLKIFGSSGGGGIQSASLDLIKNNPAIFANGDVFGAAQRFANGGTFTNQIITDPTLFKFANGSKFGLMGEAGPEAVMPLTRGPNGKLGVQAQGGGGKSSPVVFSPQITNHNSFAGAIGIDSLAAMMRQMTDMSEEQMRRNLASMLDQLERDGTLQ